MLYKFLFKEEKEREGMRQILLGSRICFPNGGPEGDLIKQNQLF